MKHFSIRKTSFLTFDTYLPTTAFMYGNFLIPNWISIVDQLNLTNLGSLVNTIWLCICIKYGFLVYMHLSLSPISGLYTWGINTVFFILGWCIFSRFDTMSYFVPIPFTLMCILSIFHLSRVAYHLIKTNTHFSQLQLIFSSEWWNPTFMFCKKGKINNF